MTTAVWGKASHEFGLMRGETEGKVASTGRVCSSTVSNGRPPYWHHGLSEGLQFGSRKRTAP